MSRAGNVFAALTIAGAIAVDLSVPRLLDGWGAREWVRWHVHQGGTGDRPPYHAREALRWAGVAVRRSAPMPWAGQSVAESLNAVDYVPADQRATVQSNLVDLKTVLDRLPGWRRAGLRTAAEDLQRRVAGGQSTSP